MLNAIPGFSVLHSSRLARKRSTAFAHARQSTSTSQAPLSTRALWFSVAGHQQPQSFGAWQSASSLRSVPTAAPRSGMVNSEQSSGQQASRQARKRSAAFAHARQSTSTSQAPLSTRALWFSVAGHRQPHCFGSSPFTAVPSAQSCFLRHPPPHPASFCQQKARLRYFAAVQVTAVPTSCVTTGFIGWRGQCHGRLSPF